jgi:predicted acetyltransferase
VEIVIIRTLKENEIEKWIDFVWGIFPYESRKFFENQWYNDPWQDINGIIVAVDEEDKILSTVRVFFRDLNINGNKVRSGGIGSVGTLEEYRGRGLSKEIFKETIKLMESRDIKISFLLSGVQNEGYYSSLGYFKSVLKYKTCAINKGRNYPTNYYIRNMDIDKDLSYLIKMHEYFTTSFNGNVARNEEYWKQWVATISGETKIAVTNSGDIIAYIHISDCEHIIDVCEFGMMPGYEDIFDSFVFKICEDRNKLNINTFFACAIQSSLPLIETSEACLCMFRLNKPMELNGSKIISTVQLIDIIKGDKTESKMLLWATDDI